MGSENLSEVLARAGVNAILGIAVVFSVLLIICLIIFCFKIFPIIEGKMKKDAEAKTPAAPVAKPAVVATEDDGELVAVIAAAIAASTGMTTDSFVVRKIKRRF